MFPLYANTTFYFCLIFVDLISSFLHTKGGDDVMGSVSNCGVAWT